MQVRDLSHPKNSKALNESVAKQFGYKLNIDSFSLDQLREARDKLTAKIATFESSNEYDAVFENTDYQKNRMFLDVITQAIAERALSPEQEKKRVAYAEGMKKTAGEFAKRFGDKSEQMMSETATKMAKTESVAEAMAVLRGVLSEQVLTEGEEEKAALIMSARDMVDKITGWLEDVASLKAESLLELVDSIRDELGNDISMSFEGKVKPALEEIYSTLETNRQVLAQAVAILTGEQGPQTMGAPDPMADPAAMSAELPVPGEEEFPAGDEFDTAAPAAGGAEPAGRAKRESIEFSRRLGTILTSKKK